MRPFIGGFLAHKIYGPQLMPAGTAILIEGDSNTAFGFNTLNWSKWLLEFCGNRLWLPHGGHLANGGSTIAYSSSSNSMIARLPTLLSILNSITGPKIVWFMIGTNAEAGQGTSFAATTELADWVSQVRATGAKVYANTCFFQKDNSNVNRITTLNNWIRTPGNVDGYLDVNPTLFTNSNGGDDTHLSAAQHLQIGQAAATYASTFVAAGTPFEQRTQNTIIYSPDLTGFTAKSGTGFSGNFPANWTPSRTSGSGAMVGSEAILEGQPAMQVTYTNDIANTTNSTFRLRRVISSSRQIGDLLDSWVRVDWVSSSTAVIPYAGLSAGNGVWPNSLIGGLDYPFPEASAPRWWRTYSQALDAATSSLNFDITVTLRPGDSATFMFSQPAMSFIGNSSVTAPVNTSLPAIVNRAQGGVIAHTPGTWTGTPTPSISFAYYLDSTAVDSSYVLQAGDVAKPLYVRETATNAGGSPAVDSAIVTVQPQNALSISGTPESASTVGATYSFTPTVSGGVAPYVFSVSGTLPTGVSLNTSTGAITGTLNTAGNFTATLTVTDNTLATASINNFSVTINAAPSLSGMPPVGTVGTPYSFTFTRTGGTADYIWAAIGTLPTGLSINSSSGLISGTPTSPGSFDNISVRVTDSKGIVFTTSPFTMSIEPAAARIAAWDATLSSGTPSQIAYTNNNRTASTTASTAGMRFGRVAVASAKTADNWYFRIRASGATGTRGFGLGTSAVGGANAVTGGTVGTQRFWWSGTSYLGATNVAMGSNISTTNRDYEISWNATLDLLWIRVVGSANWNNSASADPVAGTGGFSTSGRAGAALMPFFGVPNTTTLSSWELISGSPPSGFTQWT